MEPAQQKIKQTQIEAVITRADGTVENLGVVADSNWHWWNFWKRLGSSRRIRQANRRMEG